MNIKFVSEQPEQLLDFLFLSGAAETLFMFCKNLRLFEICCLSLVDEVRLLFFDLLLMPNVLLEGIADQSFHLCA